MKDQEAKRIKKLGKKMQGKNDKGRTRICIMRKERKRDDSKEWKEMK